MCVCVCVYTDMDVAPLVLSSDSMKVSWTPDGSSDNEFAVDVKEPIEGSYSSIIGPCQTETNSSSCLVFFIKLDILNENYQVSVTQSQSQFSVIAELKTNQAQDNCSSSL